MIFFELPWPPSVNTYWRTPRTGKLAGLTMLSKKAREYRDAAVLSLKEQRVPKDDSDARWIVTIDAYPPDKRARDLDNVLKPVLDAIVHAGVIRDDSQVDRLAIFRYEVKKNGLLIIGLSKC